MFLDCKQTSHRERERERENEIASGGKFLRFKAIAGDHAPKRRSFFHLLAEFYRVEASERRQAGATRASGGRARIMEEGGGGGGGADTVSMISNTPLPM